MTIDDRRPIPEGTFVGAVRLFAFLGKGKHFAGDDPRSAWMWVLRLDDGTHGVLTFLVNHARKPIRRFAAALTGDESLMGRQSHCDARQIIGRSAMVKVIHQPNGNGGTRPQVEDAWALPVGVEPVVLEDACIWMPTSKKALPPYAPQWVISYADTAFVLEKERKAATFTQQRGSQSPERKGL